MNKKTFRLGMISYWHVHAWDYTKQALEHPLTEIVAIWDENPDRGKLAAEQLAVPIYNNLDHLLSLTHIDAVIISAPTRMHHELIMASSRAGKHVFTEKVLAPNLKEALEIGSEVLRSRIILTVSLPRLHMGITLTIQHLLNQNILGQITKVRVRVAHDGAISNWLPAHFYHLDDCLGGALIDYGSHSLYLTRLFLNQEIIDVSARFTYLTGKSVEDNAVVVMTTKNGAIGIAEASFVNKNTPFTIEINGTEGSLMYGTPEKKLLLRSTLDGSDQKWNEQSLLSDRESPFHQWIHQLQSNILDQENIKIAIELSKLVEASTHSARENRVLQV